MKKNVFLFVFIVDCKFNFGRSGFQFFNSLVCYKSNSGVQILKYVCFFEGSISVDYRSIMEVSDFEVFFVAKKNV